MVLHGILQSEAILKYLKYDVAVWYSFGIIVHLMKMKWSRLVKETSLKYIVNPS